MRKLMGLKVGLLVVCLLMAAAVPARAQLADPLSLAASGVLLPFFSDPASGFVSIFEIASPVVPTTQGFLPAFDFTNPLHFIFFNATCARVVSAFDEQTSKQAKAYISRGSPFLNLQFNGLAAIGSSINQNDLVPLNFPIHSRVHWIDLNLGRLRVLEPIILDSFVSLRAGFLPLVLAPGQGASVGLCDTALNTYNGTGFPANLGASAAFAGINNGFCWSPLRSAATFVTPQESNVLAASIILICPRSSIQSSSGTGVFPIAAGFPRLQNRDGSFGFPSSNVISGNSVSRLRGRIYDDDETLVRDIEVPCDCLVNTPLLAIDTVYGLAPKNLGSHTVPVWYTELEVLTVNPNPVIAGSAQQFSFTGYWNLQVAGSAATLFHRMSNASRDNLSSGTFNVFANR